MSPLVSVIIPSFNHARYIATAIESVLAQTYTDWELIIIDDGSRDDTKRVLEAYSQNPKIRIVINEVNQGQSAVVNAALSLADGEYVCFLPSDDWILPIKLEMQIEKFRSSPDGVGVVYGRGLRFFEDTGEYLEPRPALHRGWVLRQLIDTNFVYPITPLFRKECFDRVKFDESYKAEGEAIYLKLAIYYQFEFVDEVVGVMRDHSSNTGKNVEMMYTDNLRYWTEFFSRPDLPAEIQKLRGPRIAKLQRLKGIELVVLRQNGRGGRKLLLSAIKSSSGTLKDPKVWAALALSFLPSTLVRQIRSRWRR